MHQPLITVKEVCFSYQQSAGSNGETGAQPEDCRYVLNKLNLEIFQGEYLAVLGPNGSGKSTLARHLNGLLVPSRGQVLVSGLDTRDQDSRWEIRSKVSMVFQNPENQIVGVTVEEDVAFGPENLGLPSAEIRRRVDQALRDVDMYDFRQERPDRLSGGQKQKTAIASALAMQPLCLVLDESTGWLDVRGRNQVLTKLKQLNTEYNIAIVHITHSMDEALLADRVIVLAQGQIVLNGIPAEVFAQTDVMQSLGLVLPRAAQWQDKRTFRTSEAEQIPVLQFQQVSYAYNQGMPWSRNALSEINLQINAGVFLGIAGHNGSGKSTLMRMFNGLLKPSSGRVLLAGQDLQHSKSTWSKVCSQVGLVLQFPEHQLFEATVFEEVAFGPRNLHWPAERVQQAVLRALRLVGLDYDVVAQASPFALSEGQKRRVAIAGILAMEPSILVLDEPLVGLDPQGRRELLDLLTNLHQEANITIIMSSHNMDELVYSAERIIVLNEGRIVMDDSAQVISNCRQELEEMGLAGPETGTL